MVLSVNDFTFEERDFENLLLLVSYNKATEYKEAFEVVFDGRRFIVIDWYCKIQELRSTEIELDFIRFEKGDCVEKYHIRYDYSSKELLESEIPLPPGMIEEIKKDDELHDSFRARNNEIFAAFEAQYIKRLVPTAKKKMLHISNKTPRNAPCLCGSGRKYKNCCGK